MRILYGFSNCSDRLYDKLVASKNLNVMRPDQKYHGLILKGLAANGNDVAAFSGLPINRSVRKNPFCFFKNEKENGVKFKYHKTLNLPVLRQLGIFIGGFFGVLFSKKEKGQTVVVCDVLNIANASGMLRAAKFKKIPTVFIVTDLPEFMYGKRLKKRAEKLLRKADGYIFLTEQMNEKVNTENKPYIIMEGLSDSQIIPVKEEDRTEFTSGIKEIIYAGGVLSMYGLPELVKGFTAADLKDCVLKIYGDGDYAEEVKKIAEQNQNVKYMGVVPNSQVVEDEKRAALLVNPRPIGEEYTKYSFPSKNMEYMASYTPVLSTDLPGMPDEYKRFLYLIEEDGENGIKNALTKVFDIFAEKRYALGAVAGEFIKENKNNIAQTKRMGKFFESISK